MAEEPAPTGTPPATTTDPANGTGKTFTQEQVNDLLARQKGDVQRRYADYDDLKSKATELDAIKEANASEIEKAQGKATKAEERAAKAEAKLLRYEVATEKKVPPELVPLLTGSSKEELEAQAALIIEHAKSGDTPPPEFDGGPREPAPPAKTADQAHNDLVTQLFGGAKAD